MHFKANASKNGVSKETEKKILRNYSEKVAKKDNNCD